MSRVVKKRRRSLNPVANFLKMINGQGAVAEIKNGTNTLSTLGEK